LPRPSDRAYLGWAGRAQESPHAALSHRAVGLAADRTPAWLRSRTQPRRTALGQPEGRRIGQPLRGRPRTSAAPGACGLPPDPEPACARSWFLAPCRLGLLTCVSLYLTRVISGRHRARVRDPRLKRMSFAGDVGRPADARHTIAVFSAGDGNRKQRNVSEHSHDNVQRWEIRGFLVAPEPGT